MLSARDFSPENPLDVADRKKIVLLIKTERYELTGKARKSIQFFLEVSNVDVLEGIVEHVEEGRDMSRGFFDSRNGTQDPGFEIKACAVVKGKTAFIHMRYVGAAGHERLRIMDAHPNTWGY